MSGLPIIWGEISMSVRPASLFCVAALALVTGCGSGTAAPAVAGHSAAAAPKVSPTTPSSDSATALIEALEPQVKGAVDALPGRHAHGAVAAGMIGTEETCAKPGTDKTYVQDTFRRGPSTPFDPTAAPTAVHYLQGLGRRFGPWAPEDESTASAQDEQSTASKNGVTMNVSIYGYLLTVTAYLPCLPNSLISGGVQTFN